MAFSPFGTSKGNKAPAYERPASVQKTAPVDDEAGAPPGAGWPVIGSTAGGGGGGGGKAAATASPIDLPLPTSCNTMLTAVMTWAGSWP